MYFLLIYQLKIKWWYGNKKCINILQFQRFASRYTITQSLTTSLFFLYLYRVLCNQVFLSSEFSTVIASLLLHIRSVSDRISCLTWPDAYFSFATVSRSPVFTLPLLSPCYIIRQLNVNLFLRVKFNLVCSSASSKEGRTHYG